MVLIVPGFWRTRRFPTMVRLGESLLARGFSSAVLDFRGHGDSGGTYGFNTHEHLDVAAVTSFLVASGFASRIVLLGFSAGAAIAISTAARHDLPIAGLLLISAVANFKRVIPRPNPFALHRHLSFSAAIRPPRFRWHERQRLEALEDIARVSAPVCLVHVRNDWLVHHDHSQWLYDRATQERELRILDIPGRLHADQALAEAPDALWPIIEGFLGRVFSDCAPSSPRASLEVLV